MRILSMEEMNFVVGGGSRNSPSNAGRPQNSGRGERYGSDVGGIVGGYIGEKLGSIAGALGSFSGGLVGKKGGGYVGGIVGDATERGFVAGANSAIDKAIRDANNAVANSQFRGFP